MRTTEDFNALLNSIHECRSFIAIELTLEQNIAAGGLSEEQASTLLTLHGLQTLDEVHAHTAELLGMTDKAKSIRAWIAARHSRTRNHRENSLFNN